MELIIFRKIYHGKKICTEWCKYIFLNKLFSISLNAQSHNRIYKINSLETCKPFPCYSDGWNLAWVEQGEKQELSVRVMNTTRNKTTMKLSSPGLLPYSQSSWSRKKMCLGKVPYTPWIIPVLYCLFSIDTIRSSVYTNSGTPVFDDMMTFICIFNPIVRELIWEYEVMFRTHLDYLPVLDQERYPSGMKAQTLPVD